MIRIDTTRMEAAARRLQRNADRIQQAMITELNAAVQEAHDQLARGWPNPLRARFASSGRPEGGLTSTVQPRAELVGNAVVLAKQHRHHHGGRRRAGRRRILPARVPRQMYRTAPVGGGGGEKLVTLLTRGDDRVCEVCEDLEGVTFTLEEANEILPVHPHCRCVWVPSSDQRFGPVIPDDPQAVLVEALRRRVPNIKRLVSAR